MRDFWKESIHIRIAVSLHKFSNTVITNQKEVIAIYRGTICHCVYKLNGKTTVKLCNINLLEFYRLRKVDTDIFFNGDRK